MKSFLLKTVILLGLCVLILIPVAVKFDLGYIDPYYTRFTTGEAPSLILGTSRAAQGLLPQEFKELAPGIQNFAFTVGHSPYGPAYLELIKKKLEVSASRGVFLVAVDPWAVSHIYPQEEEDDLESFRENGRFTSEINIVNMNPNLEYILRFYDKPLYRVFRSGHQPLRLHKDGWLEVDLPLDSAQFQDKLIDKVEEYRKLSNSSSFSPTRIKALEETIKLLSKHGEVYLVRVPVAKEIADIEKEYAPGFDEMMQAIARRLNVNYLNYIGSGDYLTIDGNHLHKEAGRAFSERVAADIKQMTKVASVH